MVNGACPHCGYCPHCGRSGQGYGYWPFGQYPQYPWYQQGIMWGGSGSLQGALSGGVTAAGQQVNATDTKHLQCQHQ